LVKELLDSSAKLSRQLALRPVTAATHLIAPVTSRLALRAQEGRKHK
jgi:hypothetical protein